MINYNDLIGIPFGEHGDGVTSINCFDLMRSAFLKHGIKVPPTNISVCSCKEASNREIYKNLIRSWEQISKPEPPCGVLISSVDQNFANHIGVFIGKNRILHITKNTDSIIERMYPKFEHKVIGFYRFIGEIL